MNVQERFRLFVKSIGDDDYVIWLIAKTQAECFVEFGKIENKHEYSMKIDRVITIVEVVYESDVRTV